MLTSTAFANLTITAMHSISAPYSSTPASLRPVPAASPKSALSFFKNKCTNPEVHAAIIVALADPETDNETMLAILMNAFHHGYQDKLNEMLVDVEGSIKVSPELADMLKENDISITVEDGTVRMMLATTNPADIVTASADHLLSTHLPVEIPPVLRRLMTGYIKTSDSNLFSSENFSRLELFLASKTTPQNKIIKYKLIDEAFRQDQAGIIFGILDQRIVDPDRTLSLLAFQVASNENHVDLLNEGVARMHPDLSQKNLTGVRILNQVYLYNLNLQAADLSGLNFTPVYPSSIGSYYQHQVKFTDMNLADVKFTWCILKSVQFDDAILTGAVFQNAILTNSSFKRCVLDGADMRDANLHGVKITEAKSFLGLVINQKAFDSLPVLERIRLRPAISSGQIKMVK